MAPLFLGPGALKARPRVCGDNGRTSKVKPLQKKKDRGPPTKKGWPSCPLSEKKRGGGPSGHFKGRGWAP